MKIAVDAMGGDYAPEEIVLGAVEAVKAYDFDVVLVGDEKKIRGVLSKYGAKATACPSYTPAKSSKWANIRLRPSAARKTHPSS